jgi:geranylgeranyl pyrophosphate synthase
MSSIGVSERVSVSIDWTLQRSAIDRSCPRSAIGTRAIWDHDSRSRPVRIARGGKRLRGLPLAAHRAAGGLRDAAALAASVEVVHAYSLIHDDLPCMDDDDIRRGRPTVHRAFGVRAATVAGVAMVPVAAVSRSAPLMPLTRRRERRECGAELMRASERAE